MYKNIKILNSQEHGFYRFSPVQDFYFAKDMNLIPITFSEMKRLCCDLPIVIVMQEDIPKLMLLTGINKNNIIDENGQWKGEYIPSFLKRYPFTLVKKVEDDTYHIGFDLESGLFSSPEGYSLFDSEGTPTEMLNNIQKFLTAFQKETQITTNILMRFKEKNVLKITQATLKGDDGEEQKVGGFYTIDMDKLREEEDEFLLQIVKNGWMELIELHKLSLLNMKKIKG